MKQELIWELAKQAGHRYYPSSNSGPLRVEYLTPELEKFAELIVRECARRSYLEDSGNPEVEEALEFWRKDMLKHFGVE